jgi:hypothetical protein
LLLVADWKAYLLVGAVLIRCWPMADDTQVGSPLAVLQELHFVPEGLVSLR